MQIERTIVQSFADAASLAKELAGVQSVVAVDTETTGCDPGEESPVGRAKLFCMTTAYRLDAERIAAAFVPAEFISYFLDWLEDPQAKKVGSGILDYDRHVFGNLDIELRGVVGCTKRMSQLLNSSKTFGHGLKPWGERLGFDVEPFSSLNHRVAPSGQVKAYKRDNPKLGRYADAPYQNIRLDKFVHDMELDVIWEHYPSRRVKIVEYAIQDPVMSLVVWEHLEERLRNLKW